MPTKWIGTQPTHCQLCKAQLHIVFFDAQIPPDSGWALICDRCFRQARCKLGTGYGQAYNARTLEQVPAPPADDAAAHQWLVHGDGSTCAAGCDAHTRADPVRRYLYNLLRSRR